MTARSTVAEGLLRAGGAADASRRRRGVLLTATIAYLPLVLTQPGQVSADTKTYLYLDPSRLLSRAPYLWDQHIGAGTVTHQNIGYLWPMGPWYWFFDTVGGPDWLAQRLWLGTLLFLAALGVRYLLGTLGWRDGVRSHGVLIASLAYMLSPYLLNYSARISVILLPWSGLPWLVALAARSLREGTWRAPALFALVALTVGGTNATALLMVAPAVLLWMVHAVWVEREVPARDAVAATGRMAVLTLVTSLWWLAGLWAQGKYGLPVLRYTETYRTVAEASNAPEVLRGLGYWFFYGKDKLGPWIEPGTEYTSRTLLLGLSYGIPILALAAAATVRWRHRSFFLLVVGTGTLLAVAGNPWGDPSPIGSLFTDFTRTDAGLALRSTPRAVPMVVLGLAAFLGAGVRAIGERMPRRAVPLTVVVGALLLLNLPPLWNGTMVAENLRRPEEIPAYWVDAAEWLDERGPDTRVLELPGSDFASYRWGNTVDPITPGLMDRPYIARELFAYGSPATEALLIALDRHLHEGTLDPDALAPVARLLGVGDVVHRADLQFERYRTARPVPLWQTLNEVPGLGPPHSFGEPSPNTPTAEQPMIDEMELALDPQLPDPPPVAAFPVDDPLAIVRTYGTSHPLIIAGDPEGVVDAAGAGLLTRGQPLFYSGAYADDPEGLAALLEDEADLLITDTNRQRARRWGTTQQNTGYTEQVGEEPLTYDPGDQRLELFPGASSDASTVTDQAGNVSATSSTYGNPVTYTPDDRPSNAIDGDPQTAWRVGAFSDVTGERLVLRFDEPVTADSLRLLQPVTGVRNRGISELELIFDGRERVDAVLDSRSKEIPGEVVNFEERTFRQLELEIRDTDRGRQERYDGMSGVGFAEVVVGDGLGRMEELVRPPVDLLDAVGSDSLAHRLTFLFSRLRSNPQEKVRFDEEVAIRRVLSLPAAREFALQGEARLSGHAPDRLVDELVGLPQADDGGITVSSSARLNGSLHNRGSAALDGDRTTAWSQPFGQQEGQYLEVTFPARRTLEHLELEIVADGRHSVPTRAILESDTGEVRELEIPETDDRPQENATVSVPLDFPEVSGRTFRFVVDAVRQETTVDWYSLTPIVMPVAIAELGIPGAVVPPPPSEFDTGCRDDLLRIDDEVLPVRITGSTSDALDRDPLAISLCPDPTTPVALAEGSHILRTGIGRDLGIDLDWISLASDAGGDALIEEGRDVTPGPEVTVVGRGPTSTEVEVEGATEPFWLVLGQSHSPGWQATVADGQDLGAPALVDGFANGWRVDPSGLGDSFAIHLEWTPQRTVTKALVLSSAGVLLCLVLAARRRRGGEGPPTIRADAPPPTFAQPLEEREDRSPVRTAVTVAALGGVAAALLTPPSGVPVIVVAVVYVSCRWRRGRHLPSVMAVLALATAGAYTTLAQYIHRYPPDFDWPGQFEAVHGLGLAAALLLLAEAALEMMSDTGSRRSATYHRGDG